MAFNLPDLDESPPETVIFLGAGASCADGAPTQAQLFAKFATMCLKNAPSDLKKKAKAYFRDFWGLDIAKPGAGQQYPTFEEAFGVVESAIAFAGGFPGYPDNTRSKTGVMPLRDIPDMLVAIIALTLDETLKAAPAMHQNLLDSLVRANWLGDKAKDPIAEAGLVFLSTNYDILIDNALSHVHLQPSYGIDFQEPYVDDEPLSIGLYKLHGSLNWLSCPSCDAMVLTPLQKGACRVFTQPDDCRCTECGGLTTPVIVPPTFLKRFGNVHLRTVWLKASRKITGASRLVFCGYSFPDADVHVKYLLKRTEMNGGESPEVFVVNNHPGKRPADMQAEYERYLRFFRDRKKVHYSDLSFSDFANDPGAVLDDKRWVVPTA